MRYIRCLPFFMIVCLLFAIPSYSQDTEVIVGDWQGTLKVGDTALRIVFHIEANDEGELSSTMDSPDQGAKGIPTSKTSWLDGKLDIEVALAGGAFSGVLEGEEIKGTWSQGGGTLPLVMKRMTEPISFNRPQEPKPPFPYKEETIRYKNGEGGIELEGTLTLPDTEGSHAAVILVSGSGPQDRNEELMGHKPFLVLADYLTRNGIAVLRYDDRGVGNSEGNFGTATTLDFATDAEAAIQFLRGRPEIDAESIGIIGHSEGGLIAPIVAHKEDSGVAFIVMLAGPGQRGKEVLLSQTTQMAHLQGMSPSLVEKMMVANTRLYDTVLDVADIDLLKIRLKNELDEMRKEFTAEEVAGIGLVEARDNQIIGQLASPWMKQFMGLDPQTYLKQVSVPVLSLIGEKDMQVLANINNKLIQKALDIAGNTDYATKTLPGLNHLFQHAETGLPAEYAKIEETFSEDVMEMIVDWIKERV